MSRPTLAKPLAPPLSRLLTTRDCAKVLGLSRSGVRHLARSGDLPFEPTRSGQMIFHAGAVQRCLLQRADARTRSRPAVLAAIQLRMVRAGIEPRQLSLLALFRPRVPLVLAARGERALCDRAVKAAELFDRAIGSEKLPYVDRKVARR